MIICIRLSTINPGLHVHEIGKLFLKIEEGLFFLKITFL